MVHYILDASTHGKFQSAFSKNYIQSSVTFYGSLQYVGCLWIGGVVELCFTDAVVMSSVHL